MKYRFCFARVTPTYQTLCSSSCFSKLLCNDSKVRLDISNTSKTLSASPPFAACMVDSFTLGLLLNGSLLSNIFLMYKLSSKSNCNSSYHLRSLSISSMVLYSVYSRISLISASFNSSPFTYRVQLIIVLYNFSEKLFLFLYS